MKKPRLAAIEYIRGISMLGVIGIHVGSQYLTTPNPSVELTALFEIVTRFCVPIFFFISAFGLFYNLEENFSYGRFLIRRGRTVMIPYIAWSLFYLKLDTYFYPVMFPDNESILEFLFFRRRKISALFSCIIDLVLSIDAALDFHSQASRFESIDFDSDSANCIRLLVKLHSAEN